MERIYRATVLALYQLTLFVGILLLPLAVATRKIGVHIPLHRAIERLDAAYDEASAS